ncbi:MAG: DUF2937 family protein [Kiloniellaceae bacterium]
MFSRLLSAFAALAGAVLLSQFPAFYDQYVQRLGGRLDQARIEVGRIEGAARAERMTVGQYIDAFLTSETSAHRRQGRILGEQVADLERLRSALVALAPARAVQRPGRFARHADAQLARATLDNFRPSVPLRPEGFVYAFAGFVAGLLVARGAERAASAVRRRRRPA